MRDADVIGEDLVSSEGFGIEGEGAPYRTNARFEDLHAWQLAHALTAKVYVLTASGRLHSDIDLCRQMRRSSVSIMSNIAEGYERGSPQEFHRFLVIAKGSCAELRSQLSVARRVEFIDQEAFDHHMNLAVRVGQLIGGPRSSVARRLSGQRSRS